MLLRMTPAAAAVVLGVVGTVRAALSFEFSSGGDGIWLLVDLTAGFALAGWSAIRLADRSDGAGYLLACSACAWALATVCETGALRPGVWTPFGEMAGEVQVAAHLLARALVVAAAIIVLPDRHADGFLRRTPAAAAFAGLTVVVLVAFVAEHSTPVLQATPFGFGNRTWIEAGRHLPSVLVAAMLLIEAAALIALQRTRRGVPPTSFQIIGWGLVACATPLAVPQIGERLPAAATDVLAMLVFPALPVVSVVAAMRSASTLGVTISRLRQAQRTLVEAVEAERRRLRHDLHDGLGPALAGIALGVRAAGGAVARQDPSTADLLGRLADEADRCLEEVRRMVYDLRPPALDQLGLCGAVKAYAERCTASGGLTLDVQFGEVPELPAAVELTAYRAAIEAVTNVVRHASATKMWLRIGAATDQLVVEVSDNGRGLPVAFDLGVGLTSMRERVESVGGRLSIGTGDRGGTSLTALLPLVAG